MDWADRLAPLGQPGNAAVIRRGGSKNGPKKRLICSVDYTSGGATTVSGVVWAVYIQAQWAVRLLSYLGKGSIELLFGWGNQRKWGCNRCKRDWIRRVFFHKDSDRQ